MNYEAICKYVFINEGIDWEQRRSEKRDRELVIARQISIYLGNMFYSNLSWAYLSAIFNQHHSTAIHAVKHIADLMCFDKDVQRRVTNYIDFIKELGGERDINYVHTVNLMSNTLDKMKLVAEIYCEITKHKLVKV